MVFYILTFKFLDSRRRQKTEPNGSKHSPNLVGTLQTDINKCRSSRNNFGLIVYFRVKVNKAKVSNVEFGFIYNVLRESLLLLGNYSILIRMAVPTKSVTTTTHFFSSWRSLM
jgi:hypothetical protein